MKPPTVTTSAAHDGRPWSSSQNWARRATIEARAEKASSANRPPDERDPDRDDDDRGGDEQRPAQLADAAPGGRQVHVRDATRSGGALSAAIAPTSSNEGPAPRFSAGVP